MKRVEKFLRKILVFLEKIDAILMKALESIYILIRGIEI